MSDNLIKKNRNERSDIRSNKKISLISGYSRSGGTLLNMNLTKYDKLVVLSEAHPIHHEKGGIHSIKEQLREWYGIKTKSNDYLQIILEAKKWCDENNKYLVIRDWSYIDFAKSHLNDNKPIEDSTNIQLLESAGLRCNKIAFVRDGIDVYLSQDKTIGVFSNEYLRFVKFLKRLGCRVFKYEDFVQNMDDVLLSMFKELNIRDIDLSKEDLLLGRNVVGDINVSRGNRNKRPVILKRRFSSKKNSQKINDNKELAEANSILSYSANYKSRESENLYDYLKFNVILNYNKVKKIVFRVSRKVIVMVMHKDAR